ncbi:MAG: hypothetical protein KDN22_05380 [Verrucomicrobiae bacterium]|nr:hypothetical protein [Verrucomicrobiae bacterium]
MRSFETHSLDFKLNADQGIQIAALNQNVSAKSAHIFVPQIEMPTQGIKYFFGKERDLPLIVVFVIVEAVPAQSFARNALDLLKALRGMSPRNLTVMAEKIVPGRNENFDDVQHPQP